MHTNNRLKSRRGMKAVKKQFSCPKNKFWKCVLFLIILPEFIRIARATDLSRNWKRLWENEVLDTFYKYLNLIVHLSFGLQNTHSEATQPKNLIHNTFDQTHWHTSNKPFLDRRYCPIVTFNMESWSSYFSISFDLLRCLSYNEYSSFKFRLLFGKLQSNEGK